MEVTQVTQAGHQIRSASIWAIKSRWTWPVT